MRMLNEKGFSKEAVGVMLGDRDLKIVENHYAQANKQRVEMELAKLGIIANPSQQVGAEYPAPYPYRV